MDQKINLGEVTLQEYNVIMKQLTAGQLGECIGLFMRFSGIGQEFQKKMEQNSVVDVPPPPAAKG